MNSPKKTSVSVFFPCYNDEKSIGILVKDAFEALKNLTDNYEVIVIDDGSKDNSPEILKTLQKQYPKLRIIFHKKNRGYGGALQSGFKAARKDLVFYTDGDGQYDVKELSILYSMMTEDVNFVNGIKMARQDPTYRIVLGNLYSFLVRWLFWVPIYDIDCDFRLIRRSLLQKIHLKSTSGSICVELVKRCHLQGAIFRQASVHHYERSFGQSQFFRPRRLLSTFYELTKLWIDLQLSKNPHA